MRKYYLTLCCILLIAFVSGQQHKQGNMDTADADSVVEIQYWKPHYYDSIPKGLHVDNAQSNFDKMITRYQTQDFEYIESISDKISFIDKLIQRIWQFIEDLFPKTQTPTDNRWFYYLLAVIGGIGVLLLIYRLFFYGKKIYIKHKDETDEEVSQIDFVEKNLMQVDIKPYISDAEAAGDFPLAIRYQQLLNIQRLSDKGYVKWDQAKTNLELMEDVENVALRSEFLKCAAIFDYVWFGDFPISKKEYSAFVVQFEEFRSKWA